MTSQKSSANKRSCAYDFKRSILSMLLPGAVSLLLASYVFIIRTYAQFSNYISSSASMSENIANIRRNIVCLLTSTQYSFYGLFSYGQGAVATGISAVIIGVFFAYCAYRFLMKKKCVNVFLSMGIDRKTMFKNRTLAALLLMAVTAGLPIIADIIMNIYYIGDAGYIIYHGVFLFLEYYTFMLVGFSMMSLAMALCNTVIEGISFGAGILWLPTVIVICFQSLCQAFLRGFSVTGVFSSDISEGRSILNYTSIFNPLLFGRPFGNYNLYVNVFSYTCRGTKPVDEAYDYYDFMNYGREYLPKEYVYPIVIWLAVCAVFLIAALCAFKGRKAENAGMNGVRSSVSILPALEIGLLAIAFVCQFTEHLGKILTVLICAAAFVLIYFILMLIAKRKIRLSSGTIISGAATFGAVVITAAIFLTGGLGYTTRTPAISDIKCATVSCGFADASGGEGVSDIENYDYALKQSYYSDTGMGIFTSGEDLQAVTKLHSALAKTTDNMTGGTVSVTYTLKNGSVMKRKYKTTDAQAAYDVLSLTDTSSYNEELTYLLSSEEKDNFNGRLKKLSEEYFDDSYMGSYYKGYYPEEDAKKVIVNGDAKLISSDGIIHNSIENTDALRDAVLADRLALTYNDIFKSDEKPLGYILFMDQKYHEHYSNYGGVVYTDDGMYDYNGISFVARFYIYPSTVNTINYLKESGDYSLLTDGDKLQNHSVSKAYVIKCGSLADSIMHDIYIDEVSYIFQRSAYGITATGDNGNSYSYAENTELFLSSASQKIEDGAQLRELSDASRIFGWADRDDYIVLFCSEDGICMTSLIRNEDAPDFIEQK